MSSTQRSQVFSDLVGEQAVVQVHRAVLRDIGGIFRVQTNSDYGIDAQVELIRDGKATGQLLAVQVKGGASAFRTPIDGGWSFPVKAKHAEYWLNHSLPVILVLADLDSGKSYWQVITSDTLQPTKTNFKVRVPDTNALSTAAAEWAELARTRVLDVGALYEANLLRIPPAAASYLRDLRAEDSRAAEALAADLAIGRADPAGAIRELTSARSEWLDAHNPLAWLTIAVFARDHGLDSDAAGAFIRLAAVRSDRRAVHLADAAITLVGIDDARAQMLTDEAVAMAPNESAVLVARALLGGETEEVVQVLSGRTDPVARSYLAHRAALGGHNDEAIGQLTALVESPHARGTVLVTLARLHLARALTADARPEDLQTAHDHALTALVGRRLWTNQTAEALATYGRILAVQLRFRELLQAAAPYPHGSASRLEAGEAEVAVLALRAAQDQRRPELYDDIVAAVTDDGDRAFLTDEVRILRGATIDEFVEHQRSALERSVARSDRQHAFDAAIQLALRGVDASTEIRGVGIEDSYVEQVHVIARAIRDPEGSLPRLRALAGTEIAPAEVVVQILIDEGKAQAAADACDLYYSVYSLPSFLLSKVKALLLVGDEDGAATTLEGLLASHQVVGEPYLEAHGFLGEYYGVREVWSSARNHFRVVVEESPTLDRTAYWNLLQCHLVLDDADAARRVIDERYIEPASNWEIRLWAQAMSETGWTDAAASLAVTLARRDETDPELAGALISNVVARTRGAGGRSEASTSDLRPAVSGDIHKEAFEVLGQLIERNGDGFPFTSLRGGTEKVLDEIRALLAQRDTTPILSMLRQVSLGNVPTGMLSEIRNDPYSLILASRGTQPRVASHPDAEVHSVETRTARAARNDRVVVDISAIELAHHLGRWEECFGQFNVTVLPAAQRADAQRGVMAAKNATAEGGTFGLDVNGQLYMTKNDPDEQLLTLKRCEEVERATRRCLVVDLGDDITFDTGLRELGMSAWLAAVELAGRQQIPLWSDDVAQRKVAASLGIPTFGTVNLIEGLREARIERAAGLADIERLADEQHRFVLELMARRVVDQPVTLEDVLADIAANPDVLSASATAISRPSWWRGRDNPFQDLGRVLTAVRTHAPEFVRRWQAAAMTGVSNAVPADLAPRMVGTLAVLGTESSPSVDDAVIGFRVADNVLAQQALPVASAHVAWAAASMGTRIAGIDPDEFARRVVDGLASRPEE